MLSSGLLWNKQPVNCNFFVYTRAFKRMRVQRKSSEKWDTLWHIMNYKALHDYAEYIALHKVPLQLLVSQ